VSGLITAVRHLTIVPVPGPGHAPLSALGRAAAWFPVVGLALGATVAGGERLASWLFPPLLAALLTITLWKLLTGGLHLDGLADCLDGLLGRDPEHRLAIMRDSRIGAFGALGLILVLLLEIAAVAELPSAVRGPALLAAPAVARATPALLARVFPPARAEGQGASFHAGVGVPAAVAGLVVALAVAVLALGWLGVAATAAGVVAALAAAALVARRIGGVTGDVLGACVELAELAVLLTVSAWTYARP
jgi:adenosylcobinamide-GDP ribazoletransferase